MPGRSLAIVGPTATGKTALAIEVAERLGGEIISVDSRQAYRGFVVGTASPTADEQARVRHHGVGFLDPAEPYGSGRFATLAHRWLHDVRARGRLPILAGGTGLFLRALEQPQFSEPPGREHRLRIRSWLQRRAHEDLLRWVERLDPNLAGHVRIDRRRATRTLELALGTGRPLSWWFTHGTPATPPERPQVFVLEMERDEHRQRIRSRIERSLEEGWGEEVAGLAAAGLADAAAFDAVGYRDVLAYVRGERTREETIERIFRATWAYARRQRTWFRHQLRAGAVRLDAAEATRQLARRIARYHADSWSR